MRRRSPHIADCKRSTRPCWAAGSHASFTMGSRAAAWVGRGSTSGQIAVPVPRNCARSGGPPAQAARCCTIEALVHRCRLVGSPQVGALLDVDVDKVACTIRRLEEIPALHPLIGALELLLRDRSRVDEIHAALAQVRDLEAGDLGI